MDTQEQTELPSYTPEEERLIIRNKDGVPRIVSFHAKRARGSMAGWLVRNRVRSVATLRDFTENGYHYDEDRSTQDVPVFVR